ncbi:STM3941 family protein [Actinomadura gamaensis]|uniref:STM3941 family protein n=1 Tax=Actinomadura gamaensis TaxID=1763541 RepID=A0ABV9TUS7_9ACTN
MSDQASELRARWLALAPFIRREILRTGRAGEPEAQWIAVNFARLQLRRVRAQMRIALLVYVVILGGSLGLLKAAGAFGNGEVVAIAIVLTVPFVFGLFVWGRGRVIAFSRIITLNESVRSNTSSGRRFEAGDVHLGTAPETPAAAAGGVERLEVRLALGKLVVRFGGIALALAIAAAMLAAFDRSIAAVAVCGVGAVIVLALLLWTLIRARRHNPMVVLAENGVRVPGWNKTVPWNRVTGVRVITVNERRGGSRVLALVVDDPEALIADLSGAYGRAAKRSLSAYGTPLSFGDHYADTTAHTIAATASAWTGLPIRSS